MSFGWPTNKGPAAIYALLFDTNDYFWPTTRGQDCLICTLVIFCIWFKRFLHFWFVLKLCPLADPPQGASGRLCTLFYTNDYFWPTTRGQVWLICSLGILVSELRDFTLSVWCTCPMFESLNKLTCLLKHEYSLTQDCREMSFTSFLSQNPEFISNWMNFCSVLCFLTASFCARAC